MGESRKRKAVPVRAAHTLLNVLLVNLVDLLELVHKALEGFRNFGEAEAYSSIDTPPKIYVAEAHCDWTLSLSLWKSARKAPAAGPA